MQDYLVKFETITLGSQAFRLRSLKDHQQFSAVDEAATNAGIYSGTWALFGVFWPSGIILASLMLDYPALPGIRILEIGCGLALSSIVLKKRGLDISASDYHPLAESFLARNLALNHLPPVKFYHCDWANDNPNLGMFDLIIGSDVLYEPNHPELVAGFIAKHTRNNASVMIIDPDRQQQSGFSKLMASAGYDCKTTLIKSALAESLGFKGRLLHYSKHPVL